MNIIRLQRLPTVPIMDGGGDSESEIEESNRTMKIRNETYQKLVQQARESGHNIRQYGNMLLTIMTNRTEISKKLKPGLSLLAAEDQSMFIRDAKRGVIAEVRLNQSDDGEKIRVNCLEDDNSEDCVHAAFAYGIFAVGLLTKLTFFAIGAGG